MTQQDHSNLSAHRPDTREQVPGAAAEGSPSRTAQPSLNGRAPALLCLFGFAAVYLIAVCTPFGQRAENALVKGYADQARIFEWAQSWGPPPLEAAMPTLVAGMAVIAAVTLLRRCWRQGCAALAVVGVTVAGTQVLQKLPRPDLADAPQSLTEASFPSGHVAIVAGLAFGAVLVASPRIRTYVATAGMLWLAVTAAGVQTLYWHRPSDAIGAALLACACYSLAARMLPADATGITWRPRALPAIAVALAAAGALAASAREDSVLRPLVFATAALLCAVLFWAAAGPLFSPRQVTLEAGNEPAGHRSGR